MKNFPFRIEPLSTDHDRSQFRCGEEALDRHLQTQAKQDIKRRIANCYVAVDEATGTVAGFYTLSAAGIPLGELPESAAKRLPRYASVPAIRIGRLAVDLRYQGKGLGTAFLVKAVEQALRGDAAAFAFMVDAKDDQAVSFYQRHGFIQLPSRLKTLFFPLASAKQAMGD